jgi:hypothetical protein
MLAGLTAAFVTQAAATLDPSLQCQLGDYRLSDSRVLTVVGYEGSAHDLEYVLSSGEFGRMAWSRAGSYRLGNNPFYGSAEFSDCASGRVEFAETGHAKVAGAHLGLPATEAFFDRGGTRLHGKLVLPSSGKADAIVVWIQGSDDDPETDDIFWQYVLPLRGVGVFTYDKRGSGRSQGELSADFYVRAADTAVAVREARRLVPGVRRVGVFGGSQGGWIAPLTATRTKVDFVIVGYSLVEGVVAQDRYEVEDQLREAGYGEDIIRKSREITAASARVARSRWTRGFRAFAAVQKKFGHEPWIGAIKETGFTGLMLRSPLAKIRVMGPKLDKDVSFNYDPRPVVASITPPQLWVLGGADHTTPNAKTVAILKDIQKRKPNLHLVIYRSADHGIEETFTFHGIRRHRYPDGYFDLIAGWIQTGKLQKLGNDAEIGPGVTTPGSSGISR